MSTLSGLSVKASILCLLGKAALKYPTKLTKKITAEQLLRYMITTMLSLTTSKDPDLPVVAGATRGLEDALLAKEFAERRE
jgi:hypothetical protein